MLPQLDPLQPLPEMLQIITGFELPLTEALNCNCVPGFTWDEDGDMLTEDAGTSVTEANAETDGAATAVAFTDTLGGEGNGPGAV